ncbi:MAG: YbaB/EbfC family nucleoid-associated protein [Streptosporangiaceae bacterium]|jgi:DNA-binding protein YbaB
MDYNEMIQQATDELREQQARLSQVREKIQESSTKVRSTDGMITVVVDGRGDLSAVTFNSAKWRRMAPAEFGAALVQTINRARAQSREDLMRTYSAFMPEGMSMFGSPGGGTSLDQMFDDAMRKANEILGDGSGEMNS